MRARVKAHPVATFLAVVSAGLIVLGRMERELWWGNWTLAAGFAVLSVAGLLTLRRDR
jgi:hypothetical protein